MSTDLGLFRVDQFYPHPPSHVWRAMTTPSLMSRWLMEADDFSPRVGHRFTMRGRPIPGTGFSGLVACQVLEATEPERLRLTWDDANGSEPTGWIVTFDLHAEGRGTRVIVTHSGFVPDDPTHQAARTIMASGWINILRRLGTLSETTHTRSPDR